MAKISESIPIYAIKITLKNIKPVIWRRLHVPSNITLAKLHDVIQIAMGWMDSHLHEFVINDERYGNAGMFDDWDDGPIDGKRVRLNQVAAPRSRFIYQYDFGDNWQHEIKIEKVVTPEAGIKPPYCVAGERACPPEDCGGVWGYEEMLETLAGPPCEERSELLEWLDDEFDPEQFDLHQINQHLKHL